MARSQPVGIWVGSLDERRDPLAVVRAAEQTSTTVLMVGDGPLRPEVERAAGAHVHVLGQRKDVPNLLRASDFFVLMSQREGLSFALLEAMACGLPAIVADIPENIEAVGDSGLAVPYGDEEATAAAFRRLARDEHERTILGDTRNGASAICSTRTTWSRGRVRSTTRCSRPRRRRGERRRFCER